jgi:NAD(P)-dependent dehydrogenase (short-subunit alcohol dehydrogenase family)
VLALTRVLAIDYARDGIRVNSIVPGTTETPLIQELLDDPHRRSALVAGEPLGRLETPEDLTGIAVYLASDESRFATGATFVVDGGLTIR